MDLPGYGYAKVSRDTQEDWGRMMGEYLENSDHLKHILLLIDIRHEPGAHDKKMVVWVQEMGIPYTIVATKADKLSRNQQQKALGVLARSLEVKIGDILPVSSVSKQGKDELVNRIGEVLSA